MVLMGAPQPCSALSLDVGHRRIGLAGCDPLGITVTPLAPLHRQDFDVDLQTIATLARQRRVQVLVVGLPLDATQRDTQQARYCRRYGLRLAKALAAQGLDLPLVWVNEHTSTQMAAERFGLHGDRTGRLDSASAALLLEQWLREGPLPQPLATATPLRSPPAHPIHPEGPSVVLP
jgi:putative holliday junction resolvase